jgi:hypothetical protein
MVVNVLCFFLSIWGSETCCNGRKIGELWNMLNRAVQTCGICRPVLFIGHGEHIILLSCRLRM